MNAYITAIDTETNQIIWRSQPLVANSSNFVIKDNVIISGYGFTAEPDYIYLLSLDTGYLLQQIPVKSAPEYLILQDNKLYVRTYNTDYVYQIKN
jgi:outer membrane protein assembly factor BamB